MIDLTTFSNTQVSTTTTPSRATWTDLHRDEIGGLYYDFGSGFFDGDFEHKFTCQRTAYNDGRCGVWALTNALYTGMWPLRGSAGPALLVEYVDTATQVLLFLYEIYGTEYYAMSGSWNPTTTGPKRLTVTRDESIGTYGRLYLNIPGLLIPTIHLDLHAKVDFRYFYAIMAEDFFVDLGDQSGYTEDYSFEIGGGGAWGQGAARLLLP